MVSDLDQSIIISLSAYEVSGTAITIGPTFTSTTINNVNSAYTKTIRSVVMIPTKVVVSYESPTGNKFRVYTINSTFSLINTGPELFGHNQAIYNEQGRNVFQPYVQMLNWSSESNYFVLKQTNLLRDAPIITLWQMVSDSSIIQRGTTVSLAKGACDITQIAFLKPDLLVVV